MAKLNGYTVTTTHTSITITFNGEPPVTISLTDIPVELHTQLAMLGLKNKLVDSMALTSDKETGLPATGVMKRTSLQRMVNTLKKGEWTLRRATSPDQALSVIAALQGITVEELKVKLGMVPTEE